MSLSEPPNSESQKSGDLIQEIIFPSFNLNKFCGKKKREVQV